MDQAHGGGGLVDVLSARAAGPVDLHLDVLLADLHGVVVLDLRHDLHGGKGGLPPGVCVEGGDTDQTVDAVLAAEEAIGVFPLDGDGGGLDARLVPVLVVQGLDGEIMPLAPAGVHAEKHLAPVLGLGAAGAGVERQDGVVGVILPGEQGGQIGLLQGGLQGGIPLLHLGKQAGVVLLHGHFHQSGQVLPLGGEAGVMLQLVFQLLGALKDLLGGGYVVPEVGAGKFNCNKRNVRLV